MVGYSEQLPKAKGSRARAEVTARRLSPPHPARICRQFACINLAARSEIPTAEEAAAALDFVAKPLLVFAAFRVPASASA